MNARIAIVVAGVIAAGFATGLLVASVGGESAAEKPDASAITTVAPAASTVPRVSPIGAIEALPKAKTATSSSTSSGGTATGGGGQQATPVEPSAPTTPSDDGDDDVIIG